MENNKLTRGQAEGLLDHFRALQKHLPHDYQATQRELTKIRKELKALGYQVLFVDGDFSLKQLPQTSKE